MRIPPFPITLRPPQGWVGEARPGGFGFGRPDGMGALLGMGGVYPEGQDLPQGAMALLADMLQHVVPVGAPRTGRSGEVDHLHARYSAIGQDGSPLDVALSCAHAANGLGGFVVGFAPAGQVPDLAHLVASTAESFAFGAWAPDEDAMRAIAGLWRHETFQGNRGYGGGGGSAQTTVLMELRPDGTFSRSVRSTVAAYVPGASGFSDGRSQEETGHWFVMEGHLVLATRGQGCLTQPMRTTGTHLVVGEDAYARVGPPQPPPQAHRPAPPDAPGADASATPAAAATTPPDAAGPGTPTRLAPWPVTFEAPAGWLVQVTPLGAAMGAQGGGVLVVVHAGLYPDPQRLLLMAMKAWEPLTQEAHPTGAPRPFQSAGRAALALGHECLLKNGEPAAIESSAVVDSSGLGVLVSAAGPLERRQEMAEAVQRVLASLAFGPLQVDEAGMRAFVGRWTRYTGSSSGHSSSSTRSSSSAFSWYEFQPDGTWRHHRESSMSATVPGLTGLTGSQDTRFGRWLVVEGRLVLVSEEEGCEVVEAQPARNEIVIHGATYAR